MWIIMTTQPPSKQQVHDRPRTSCCCSLPSQEQVELPSLCSATLPPCTLPCGSFGHNNASEFRPTNLWPPPRRPNSTETGRPDKSLLCQLLCIGARAGPPIRDSEQEAMILANPIIEGVVADLHGVPGVSQALHCSGCSPEDYSISP